jgi:hypothetical protein
MGSTASIPVPLEITDQFSVGVQLGVIIDELNKEEFRDLVLSSTTDELRQNHQATYVILPMLIC